MPDESTNCCQVQLYDEYAIMNDAIDYYKLLRFDLDSMLNYVSVEHVSTPEVDERLT